MKKSIVFITALILFVTAVLLTPVFSEPMGDITVDNQTKIELSISIDGDGKGKVMAGQSRSFDVSLDDHTVKAGWDDGSIETSYNLTTTFPQATWVIKQSDLKR